VKVVTSQVLAAGYRILANGRLTHACAVDGPEFHVLCKRVRPKNLVAYYEHLEGPEASKAPTCPACLAQWQKYQEEGK
jgi:hypothetical protein